MIRLFLVLAAVAAAFAADKNESAPSKEVPLLNFKAPPAINIFDSPVSFENFKIIENIIFLNEAEECRSKYPKINETKFYKHLYCSLKNEQYTTSEGISCNMTKPLVKKIQKRLNDFVVFRSISKTNGSCGENFRPRRNSLDSDLLPGFELMAERPKEEIDRSYVYLGPSRFPLTTELDNRLINYKESTKGVKKSAGDQEPVADKKKTGKKLKNKPKQRAAQKVKRIKSPKSTNSFFKLFKFRTLRENEGDHANSGMLGNLDETKDLFYEMKGNSFLYFKLFETFLNIMERFNEHMEVEKSKELLDDQNEGVEDVGKDGKEEEKKEMDEEGERVKVEEEEEGRTRSKVFSNLNNYQTEAPKLYYTISWEEGTKVK